jgi:hypothetical protein
VNRPFNESLRIIDLNSNEKGQTADFNDRASDLTVSPLRKKN